MGEPGRGIKFRCVYPESFVRIALPLGELGLHESGGHAEEGDAQLAYES